MTSGLPPSSFNYPGSSSSSSSKRHSVPASPSGPRPLHLLDLAGPYTSSPTTCAAFLSPTRGSSPVPSPSRVGFSPSHPPFSAPHSQSSTPRSVKRQSAISYFSPDHESTREVEKELVVKRTSSPGLGGGGATGARPGDGTMDIRASVDALVPVVLAEDRGPEKQKDRPHITSAEKHAELLHFIAQKEAKCLELRSQLAMHEEELIQLKRKWERIINRGLERENSSAESLSSTGYPSPTNTKDIDIHAALMALTANPSLTLEGIREGVQGMSRMLAAGLSITAPTPTPITDVLQPNDTRAPNLNVPSPAVSRHSQPSPLSAASPVSAGGAGKPFVRHAARESSSSNATGTTTTTARSSMSAGMMGNGMKHHRLSQCSSSATSWEDDEVSNTTATATATGRGSANMDGQKKMKRKMQEQDVYSPQELMISDTGATPTVSPNPAFLEQNERRRERLRRRQEEAEKGEGEGGRRGQYGQEEKEVENVTEHDEVAWDAWGDVDEGEGEVKDVDKENGKSGAVWLMDPPKTRGLSSDSRCHPAIASATTPLASSIPTFGAATQSIAGLSALASPQVSLWMGSMSKKLNGELQKSSGVLSRSQKRASLMFSDMSQSFVHALSTSTNTPSSSSSSTCAIIENGQSVNRVQAISLLDDVGDDEQEEFGPLIGSAVVSPQSSVGAGTGKLMEAMKPDVRRAGEINSSSGLGAAVAVAQDHNDEEEWNW